VRKHFVLSALVIAVVAAATATAGAGTSTGAVSSLQPISNGPSAIACSLRGSANWFYDEWDHEPIALDVSSTGSGPCVLTDNDPGGTPRKIDRSASYTYFAEKVLPGSPFGPPGTLDGTLTISIDNTALSWGAFAVTDPPETDGEIPLQLAINELTVPPSAGAGLFTDHLFGMGEYGSAHPVAITMQAVWGTYCPACDACASNPSVCETAIQAVCSLTPLCSASDQRLAFASQIGDRRAVTAPRSP